MPTNTSTQQDVLYQRDAAALEVSVGPQTVICSAESGKFCDVNAVGHTIWKLLEQPRSIHGIVSALRGRYNVDEATCQRDTVPFLDTLLQAGLIARVDPNDRPENP